MSFIGYKTQYSEFVVADENRQPIVRNFTLPTDETVLQELVVQGQRPALRAENGKLIYHAPTLLRGKGVTNAYEALKEIPGVMEQGERLTLIGTSGMTVLLNGRKTLMTTAQLMAMLKSIPLSRVEDVEIMYSTPPQYNIRGAAINVVLKQQGDDAQNVWQGEVAGEYRQRTHATNEWRASMLYLGKRTTADALYSYNNPYTYEGGNPSLQPMYTQKLPYLFGYKDLQMEVSYNWIEDYLLFTAEQFQDKPITMFTMVNLPRSTRLDANISYSPKIGWWRPTFEAGINKQNLEYKGKTYNKPYFTYSWNNIIQLPKAFLLTVNMRGNLQGESDVSVYRSAFRADVRLSKRLLNNKLNLTLAATDIFVTDLERWSMEIGNILYE